ncbi:MAG: alpha/beta hydrolase [Candidatus Odinarchaeota archaeon]
MKIDAIKLRNEFTQPHYLISTSDGILLFLRAWTPPTPSKVAILIFHGITAYSGPYKMIGDVLSRMGYAVYGLDLRGHGLSDGNRGDYPSKERFIKDIGETIQFLKEKHSTLIILGHSLGVMTAIIASNFFLESISGLILLSGARTMREGVYAKISFRKKLKILFSSLIRPSKPIVSYHRDGMIGLDDPLFNFSYTLRFMSIFNIKKFKFPDKLDIPVLLGVGENDELFSVESVRSFFDEIPSNNKKFIVLSGARHAEFGDNSFTELIKWLTSTFKQNQ